MKKGFKEYSMLLRQNYKPNLILQLKYSMIEVNVIIVSYVHQKSKYKIIIILSQHDCICLFISELNDFNKVTCDKNRNAK